MPGLLTVIAQWPGIELFFLIYRSHAPAWECSPERSSVLINTASTNTMGRSRYTITEPDKPHFMTCTVMEWLPVFTRPETVQIVLDCWHYQRKEADLKLFGYITIGKPFTFYCTSEKLEQMRE